MATKTPFTPPRKTELQFSPVVRILPGVSIAMASTKIKTFVCPSDNMQNTSGAFCIVFVDLYFNPAATPPVLDAQPVGVGSGSLADGLGKTNYLGVAGYWGYTNSSADVFEGPYPLGQVTFVRGEGGKVTGFRIDAGAVRNLRFARVKIGPAE